MRLWYSLPDIVACTRFEFRYRWFAPLIGALLAVRCGSSPAAPTPPPVVVTDPPRISCPSAITVASSAGTPLSVAYGTATTTAGESPVQVACTPASQSTFPVGATTVTCTATDARQRSSSCTFQVTVTAPPRLSLTRFLAFGDSMTAGEIVSEGLVPLLVDPALAYPTDLQRLLTVRYGSQQAFVGNAGQPGETTAQGVIRLATLIPGQYHALLLMAGANDISGGDPLAVQPAATNVQRMVRAGKSAGLRVFLATLPPQNAAACRGSNAFPGCVSRSGGADLVVGYNDALKLVAAQEAVSIVDPYQAFAGDVSTLVDFDGLHPTAAGYQRIADTFFSVIKLALEIPAGTVNSTKAQSGTGPFLVPPPRR